ncbi:hypothetical protein MED121_04938 [Marinomonas sp. MED121]|uniref:hypothetical protein n=1 Tax=Marinomonas sp. MED121 TaxID=314277 RepID=UPI00006901D0|nr:hypothetical protein [Marinomonas sp. MED121]EAQ64437.1 hypothetical protein MED121_04938 [Marinomonas sp. MED121]
MKNLIRFLFANCKFLLSLQNTGFYHCVSSYVGCAFLCSQDKLTGQSYEHRRGWIEDKILSLAAIFAIDVCAYAVMLFFREAHPLSPSC